jgi:hypothetical protein
VCGTGGGRCNAPGCERGHPVRASALVAVHEPGDPGTRVHCGDRRALHRDRRFRCRSPEDGQRRVGRFRGTLGLGRRVKADQPQGRSDRAGGRGRDRGPFQESDEIGSQVLRPRADKYIRT